MIGNGKARTSSHIFPPPHSTLVQACSLIHLGRGGGGSQVLFKTRSMARAFGQGSLSPGTSLQGLQEEWPQGMKGALAALAASQKRAQLGARETPGAQAREVGACPGH